MTYWISKTAEISNKTVHTNAGVALFFIVVFLCVCMTAALLILHKKQLLNIKTYFLTSAISLGLVYMLIFPVWTIPDAKPHFAAAYRFSSILLGHSGSEEWTGRKEDAQFSGKYRRQTEKAADRNPAVAGYAVLAQIFH